MHFGITEWTTWEEEIDVRQKVDIREEGGRRWGIRKERELYAVRESFCFWLFRLSIYSLLMNQVWLFLFLSRPRARLLLWAGRFLSVPPRLHPGIFREEKREREREKRREKERENSRATFGLSLYVGNSCAPEFFSQLVFLIWCKLEHESSDGTVWYPLARAILPCARVSIFNIVFSSRTQEITQEISSFKRVDP